MNIKLPEFKFNNPIGEHKLDEMIQLLNIKSDDTILDVGGGSGHVLLKMLQNSQAKGILVELNEKLVEQCKTNLKLLPDSKRVTLIHEDANTYLKKLEPQSMDCIVCIASTHIFGDYKNCVKELMPYLKPSGFLLIGEGFWKKKPSKEYLEILGGVESELMLHHENIETPEELGLTYLYSHIASEDDFNTFEGIYFLEEEYKARQLPQEQRKKKQKNLRAFRNCQFKFGRATMGFGLYLFENTPR